MGYEKFVESVREVVASFCGAEVIVTVTRVQKNNGVCKIGLMMKNTDSNIAPTVYLEDFYQEFQKGKSVSEIARVIAKVYKQNKTPVSFRIEEFKNFDQVKDKIVYRIINRDKNQELLKESPYLGFLDLAVVPYAVFPVEEGNSGTVLIKKEHLELWGITEEEILSIASENTPKMLQPRIRKMEDTLRELFEVNHIEQEQEVELFLKDLENNREKVPMYVLTNQRNLYGAACMLYQGVIEMFTEQIEEDVYILPSSIHEVLLIPASKVIEANELVSMVQEINATQVPVEEVLSDNVYRYSMAERGFCIV